MITITERAAEEIKLSTQNPDTQGLQMRFAVEKTDTEFRYLMGFDQRADSDIHLRSNGVEYVFAYAQKELLSGMVVDFDEISVEGGYGFIFMNPNDPNYEPPAEKLAPDKN
ncbi:MAG: sulfur oxidoreductase [Candidatus Thioglobus sp.]|nr:MAG: sulfur oxidoreductase [Candidatus Thioglobus sp.]